VRFGFSFDLPQCSDYFRPLHDSIHMGLNPPRCGDHGGFDLRRRHATAIRALKHVSYHVDPRTVPSSRSVAAGALDHGSFANREKRLAVTYSPIN
jgi:hypothetical protein